MAKLMNLQQAIESPLACEERQLKNWLTMLSEYIKRDTDMKATKICLAGNFICPACGKKMALDVENFCDRCGQKIKFKG